MQKKQQKTPLLEVRNLKKYFPVNEGFLGMNKQTLKAVNDVSFSIYPGETLGIVGESGCGKSTLGNVIMNMLSPTEGEVLFEGRSIHKMNPKEQKEYKRSVQMIFQDPFSSLNPRMRVKDIIAEPMRAHNTLKGKQLELEIQALMKKVGLSPKMANRFPHEFSGGQRQRIVIARALALKPKVIVCDEAVSALDVSIQAQILNLLKSLQREFNLTLIFIAHGLPAIKYISDRIGVMYLGKMVELASKEDLFIYKMHPYTNGLLDAVPVLDPRLRDKGDEMIIKGDLPSPVNLPSGCSFHPRCPFTNEKCKTIEPKYEEREPNHFTSCHYPLVSNQKKLSTV